MLAPSWWRGESFASQNSCASGERLASLVFLPPADLSRLRRSILALRAHGLFLTDRVKPSLWQRLRIRGPPSPQGKNPDLFPFLSFFFFFYDKHDSSWKLHTFLVCLHVNHREADLMLPNLSLVFNCLIQTKTFWNRFLNHPSATKLTKIAPRGQHLLHTSMQTHVPVLPRLEPLGQDWPGEPCSKLFNHVQFQVLHCWCNLCLHKLGEWWHYLFIFSWHTL